MILRGIPAFATRREREQSAHRRRLAFRKGNRRKCAEITRNACSVTYRRSMAAQPSRQELVEMVAARFAFDAEAAGVVGAALQTALHFLADLLVLELYLV